MGVVPMGVGSREGSSVTDCPKCKDKSGVDPWCIPCVLRWFRSMPDAEWIAYNAPLILYATSAEHMEKVREAFKAQSVDEQRKNIKAMVKTANHGNQRNRSAA